MENVSLSRKHEKNQRNNAWGNEQLLSGVGASGTCEWLGR